MDELKLQKWQKEFEKEIRKLKEEVDAIMSPKKIEDFYDLKVDNQSQMLCLTIDSTGLPTGIEKQVRAILEKTKPEDSI